MTDGPVTSAEALEFHTPAGSPNTYSLAPLSYPERTRFRAHLIRVAGSYPNDQTVRLALRVAVQATSPGNAAEILAQIDLAEAEPGNLSAQVQVAAIENACSTVPALADLLSRRQFHVEMIPWVVAQYGLRGWAGPDLPEFERDKSGLVPEALLELLPPDDLSSLGYRLNSLTRVNRRAEGNSGSPSPSPATPKPAPKRERSRRGSAGSSAARNTKPTRA